jgi:uncharacterized protein DUF3109
LIAIDNKLISDDIVSEQFVCDLNRCKGGCCEDGDAGAPLEQKEMQTINEVFEIIRPLLTPEGLDAIENNGRYHYDKEFGWVTPTVGGKICAYGFRDEHGIIRCAFEKAFHDGKTNWKKPMSCHLFPIKIKRSKRTNQEFLNYEPREGLCNPACALGKKLKVPVYVFLKDALIRKYGEEFFASLDASAKYIEKIESR